MKDFHEAGDLLFAVLHHHVDMTVENETPLLGAFERLGTKAVQDDLVNAYGASATGIGGDMARMMSAAGGRTASEHVQVEFERMMAVESGESGLVAAYKLANAADITRTYLSNLPLAKSNPNIQALLHKLDKFPPPKFYADKMRTAKLGGQEKTITGQADKLRDTVTDIAKKTSDEDSPMGDSDNNGLPPGVKRKN